MILAFAVVLAFASFSLQQAGNVDALLDTSLGVPLSVRKDWAETCPYIPLAFYEPPPIGCKIDQVSNLLEHLGDTN